MAHRVSLLLFVFVAVVLGACSAQPTGPRASALPLRDTEEPQCVDTVYVQAQASAPADTNTLSGSPSQGTSSSACHVVIVYY